MKRVGLVFSGVAMVMALASHAVAEPRCRPTAQVSVSHYPGAKNIPSNNNLILPTGKSIPASGQKLLFVGRVLDSRCMPVPEAIVEMWQANPFGEWILAGPDDLATPNATFAGAGRAITDTDGQFQFITAFPAAAGKRAPNLNIKIRGEGVPNFSTVLYFANDQRNGTDSVYKNLTPAAREDVTLHMGNTDDGDLAAITDIVLPSRAPYRTY